MLAVIYNEHLENPAAATAVLERGLHAGAEPASLLAAYLVRMPAP